MPWFNKKGERFDLSPCPDCRNRPLCKHYGVRREEGTCGNWERAHSPHKSLLSESLISHTLFNASKSFRDMITQGDGATITIRKTKPLEGTVLPCAHEQTYVDTAGLSRCKACHGVVSSEAEAEPEPEFNPYENFEKIKREAMEDFDRRMDFSSFTSFPTKLDAEPKQECGNCKYYQKCLLHYGRENFNLCEEYAHASDIDAYDAVAAQCREIFLERRSQYGNHLDKPKQYHEDSLYIKAVRLCADHEAGKEMDPDTLRDFVNYAVMVLTFPLANAGR